MASEEDLRTMRAASMRLALSGDIEGARKIMAVGKLEEKDPTTPPENQNGTDNDS